MDSIFSIVKNIQFILSVVRRFCWMWFKKTIIELPTKTELNQKYSQASLLYDKTTLSNKEKDFRRNISTKAIVRRLR